VQWDRAATRFSRKTQAPNIESNQHTFLKNLLDSENRARIDLQQSQRITAVTRGTQSGKLAIERMC